MALSTALTVSCNPIQKSFEDTFTPIEEVEEARQNAVDQFLVNQKTKNFLSDSAALVKAQSELRQMDSFKNKSIQVYSSVHFYDDGRINIKLQDPNKPENIDEYGYRDGKWRDPEPVIYRNFENIREQLYALDDIKFSAVNTMYKDLAQRSTDIEGVETVTHIYYIPENNPSSSTWRASITGTRERYSAEADPSGEITEFERY